MQQPTKYLISPSRSSPTQANTPTNEQEPIFNCHALTQSLINMSVKTLLSSQSILWFCPICLPLHYILQCLLHLLPTTKIFDAPGTSTDKTHSWLTESVSLCWLLILVNECPSNEMVQNIWWDNYFVGQMVIHHHWICLLLPKSISPAHPIVTAIS